MQCKRSRSTGIFAAVAASSVVVLLVIFTASVGLTQETAPESLDKRQAVALIRVSAFGREGVVFPASRGDEAALRGVDGYWTPSTSDIETLESHLRAFLDVIVAEDDVGKYQRTATYNVIRNLEKYRRQYVGFIEDGSRQILVNALLGPPTGLPIEDWDRRYVYVADGGFSYWRVVYDMDRRRFHAFYVNGEG